MKCLTFFSEKGGVGKTSFGMIYASFLRYKCGVRSAMMDFNNRISAYRKREIQEKKLRGTYGQYEGLDAWPLAAPRSREEFEAILRDNKLEDNGYVRWAEKQISKDGSLADTEVLILDFPGAITGGEYFQFLTEKWIGMTVIPTDRDSQTLESTRRLSFELTQRKYKHMAFLNQIQLQNDKRLYVWVKNKLMDFGVPVLPDMVSFSERMKKIEDTSIIRSTLEYPDWDDKAFRGSRDLGIHNLFVDISRELATTPDIPGTEPVELAFAASLEKERNDERQLNGTSFPQYEMELRY